MSNKKQTAVEWYSQQHLKLLIKLENKELSIGEYAVQHQEILHKAKAMEKRQIIDASTIGFADGLKYMNNETQNFENAEQYYKETYEQ